MYVLCCTDIAVIVFNNCTTDNIGKMVPGGTEVVTRDSEHFMVTFDYEFLEDFREKKTQGWQLRDTTRKLGFYGGLSGPNGPDEEALLAADEADASFFPTSTLKRRKGVNVREGAENRWGPEGFNKNNHPLNVMVCVECSFVSSKYAI